jgi:hypothetical protein
MTGAQAIEKFLIYYDRIYSQSAKGYLDEEILTFISDATREIVDTLYFSKKYELCPIQVQNLNVSSLSNASNVKLYLFNYPIRHIVKITANTSRTKYPPIQSTLVECVPANYEDVIRLGSKHEVFIFPNVLYSHVGNRLYLVGDTFTIINTVSCEVIPDIPDVQINTSLPVPNTIIDMIIKRAAEIAKAVSDPIRVQSVNTNDSKS